MDAASVSQTITRSPADLLRLVVAVAVVVVLLLFEWLFGDSLVGFVSDLLSGLRAIPQWIIDVAVVAARIISIVVLVAGLLWTIVRSGMRMLITVAVGVGLAVVMVIVLGDLADIADGANSVEVSSGLGPLTDATFPSVFGIAALAGALTAAAPWLSRRWRRWGWVAVLGLVFTPIRHDADVVRLRRVGAVRLARRRRRPRAPRRADATSDGGRASCAPSPRWGCRWRPSKRRASTPAVRRRTSASGPTAAGTS